MANVGDTQPLLDNEEENIPTAPPINPEYENGMIFIADIHSFF